MFSNITNQFTSLVGAVKGGQGDEEVPAANTQETATTAAPSEHHDATAASTAGGELPEGEEGAKSSSSFVDSLVKETTGWLGSAKGWLGSASIPSMPAMPSMPSMPSMPAMPSIPNIPGLRKGAEGEPGAEGDAAAAAAAGTANATAAGEEDDKSRYLSATEGADSHPASGDEGQLGEEGQIGQGKGDDVKITTKVTQQAKHFGSFLTSAFSEAGSKIKETVKKNPILESFNKEQEAFIKGQAGGNGAAVAPWSGLPNEGKIKEEIMGLSQDRRNFVRAPPAGVDFEFNYETAYPTAIAIMAEDKNLETMRFELVPKIITEENFWRNYFYRVSLIIQAAELGTLGEDGVAQASSGEDVKEQQSVITTEPLKTETFLDSKNPEQNVKFEENLSATNKTKRSQLTSESEFVSDAFQNTTENDLEEIKDGMRKLGIDSMTQQQPSTALSNNDEEQWEKDLEAELKDYEVVDNGAKDGGGPSSTTTTTTQDNDDELPTISNLRTRSNNDWEEYADLIEDTDDLK
ncbi:synapse-associated protein of 47 kDa isoform X1 [Lucilia cuprina]|uniref:synapse-associated protein of 47 kDa isoform X1 n=1 Tax=Lucilia cuprina TaxID=7375 RepID=UPI001F0704A2|nr:synapse-associated protein of 47 kDa isoform X1 [Lucilia cuprina]XP_046804314.1 synapse-associated protein of 47 kDa isoform X1 [Lucilia cuprina]XP_046804315.1 synapse-associated protein of 47 kDa isoform X1 [Lucilia cuprina]XP_046804316.1 synapse-associated protein of 47 kDa isoform X1 [Lucilia cuprina]XP_046804317.1 synapse-associated protein of 47 kDa isoform X1 [Lucilia cuprina]XP_046804318.1 synapse-associated protein of 47 kDa isoform X1 [Lucilia cuprina]